MKKVLLLTILVVLLVSLFAVPITRGHQGHGKGYYDYQGRGIGHEKHGDGGCSCDCPDCTPCTCEPPCVPPCDGTGGGSGGGA